MHKARTAGVDSMGGIARKMSSEAMGLFRDRKKGSATSAGTRK